ncbi:MAG TPA: hypothetical protein VGE07_29805 [Herpetosiphonaceae bacterium]
MFKRLTTGKGGDEAPRNDASEDETPELIEINRKLAVKWWRWRTCFLPIKRRELKERQEGSN